MKTKSMPPKFWIVILLLFALLPGSQAQKTNTQVGINVTSVLSAFVGNDNDIKATDVPFMVRWGAKRKMRLGFGAGAKSNEFFDVISQVTRTSDERQFLARVGFQTDILRENKWGVYWGVDLIGSYSLDRVRSRFNNNENRILKEIFGVGGGPIIGMSFNITERIFLSTEASLYTLVSIVQDRESGQGLQDSKITTYNFEFQAAPPLFLYLNYAF